MTNTDKVLKKVLATLRDNNVGVWGVTQFKNTATLTIADTGTKVVVDLENVRKDFSIRRVNFYRQNNPKLMTFTELKKIKKNHNNTITLN